MRRPAILSATIAGLVWLWADATALAQVPAQAPAAAPAARPAPAPTRPPVHGYEVVNVFPHDPAAFTQGLQFHDGVLFESTGRHPSTVRRVRLEDGVVLGSTDLEMQYFGEGLAVIGDRVLSLTWQHGRGFIWNAETLEPEGTFSYAGEGWGLTSDGSRLILSDGSATLRFLDPQTFAQTGTVPVTFMGRPLTQINELEFIDGEVWANIWQTNFIVRIDPATGVVKSVVDLTGILPDRVANPVDDVLNGIAWDAENRRLFVTGKNWPKLFEIRLTDPQ